MKNAKAMKKYTVELRFYGNFTTEVEAADQNNALEKAREKAYSIDKDHFNDEIDLKEDNYTIVEHKVEKVHKKTFFQPVWYSDDSTNIEYGGLPEGLSENQYFKTQHDCANWLREHNYDPGDFCIMAKDLRPEDVKTIEIFEL